MVVESVSLSGRTTRRQAISPVVERRPRARPVGSAVGTPVLVLAIGVSGLTRLAELAASEGLDISTFAVGLLMYRLGEQSALTIRSRREAPNGDQAVVDVVCLACGREQQDAGEARCRACGGSWTTAIR